MKLTSIAAVALTTCALAFASPLTPIDPTPPTHPVIVPPADGDQGGGGPAPAGLDADFDGYLAALDCNDADPAVKPDALELANGLDDDCDGVVDDGFDTTIDWPRVDLATPVWPPPGGKAVEGIPTETQPRLIWTGDQFMAVWIDLGHRLRVARIGTDTTLLAPPGYLRKPVRSLDAAWTGTRLGIVYEDAMAEPPSVRLMLVDHDGLAREDVLVATSGSEPKLAWGQDRFGIVWKDLTGPDSLRFQRFDASGRPMSPVEALPGSRSNAAVAFSGTTVLHLDGERYTVAEGLFGIAYEAWRSGRATAGVLLSAYPREPERIAPIGPVRVNQHDDSCSEPGSVPSIAANVTGFAVGWHTKDSTASGLDRAQARFFSAATLAPVQEFTPDSDAGRYGRISWTGGEFVMANDNMTGGTSPGFDVHVRRCDPSGNTHPDAVWGPWNELNLRGAVPGSQSVHPDVVNAGPILGVVWVERDEAMGGDAGRIWIAIIVHT